MKKSNRRFLWILIILLAIALAITAGYYFVMKKDTEQGNSNLSAEKGKTEPKVVLQQAPQENIKENAEDAAVEIFQVKKEIKAKKEALQVSEEKISPHIQEDPCKVMENQVLDFFTYLNSKDYIGELEEEMDTYEWFKQFIKKVSSHPPVPAGEGLDKDIIIRNIFHFFRILNRKDIRLIKEVLYNESDTLEMNLDLFYSWLMAEECPDDKVMRPSSDIIYHYAGYFLNTLGGNAYLSRRLSKERLLIEYYSVITLYKMDASGKNSYGIDIFPFVNNLLKDIFMYPDLQFKDYYIDKLNEIQKMYEQKR